MTSHPFSHVFIIAVVIGALARIIEIYCLVSTVGTGAVVLWKTPVVGSLGMAGVFVLTSVFLTVFALFEVIMHPRVINKYLTLGTCLMLVVYTVGISTLYQALKSSGQL